MRSHRVFGVRIDDVSVQEVERIFGEWLLGNVQRRVVTPNPEFLLLSRRDAVFCDTIIDAHLSLPDGVGLRFAVPALTGATLQHRVTGVDALRLLAAHAQRLVLIGGAALEGRAAAQRLGAQWIDVGRVGDDGALDPHVVTAIAQAAPDALAAALGGVTGKQEKCLARYLAQWPSVKVAIGVGGALEMIAGTKRRAPRCLRVMGFEWLWRLVIEPQRWRRILSAFPLFPLLVVWTTLRQRRFFAACRVTLPEILRQITGR